MKPLALAACFLLSLVLLSARPAALGAQEGGDEGQAQSDERPRPQKKSKGKKKGYDYSRSRYKAYRVLTDKEPRTYRFDEEGNPILPAVKKKKKAAKKKLRPRPEAEESEAAPPVKEEPSEAKVEAEAEQSPREDVAP